MAIAMSFESLLLTLNRFLTFLLLIGNLEETEVNLGAYPTYMMEFCKKIENNFSR